MDKSSLPLSYYLNNGEPDKTGYEQIALSAFYKAVSFHPGEYRITLGPEAAGAQQRQSLSGNQLESPSSPSNNKPEDNDSTVCSHHPVNDDSESSRVGGRLMLGARKTEELDADKEENDNELLDESLEQKEIKLMRRRILTSLENISLSESQSRLERLRREWLKRDEEEINRLQAELDASTVALQKRMLEQLGPRQSAGDISPKPSINERLPLPGVSKETAVDSRWHCPPKSSSLGGSKSLHQVPTSSTLVLQDSSSCSPLGNFQQKSRPFGINQSSHLGSIEQKSTGPAALGITQSSQLGNFQVPSPSLLNHKTTSSAAPTNPPQSQNPIEKPQNIILKPNTDTQPNQHPSPTAVPVEPKNPPSKSVVFINPSPQPNSTLPKLHETPKIQEVQNAENEKNTPGKLSKLENLKSSKIAPPEDISTMDEDVQPVQKTSPPPKVIEPETELVLTLMGHYKKYLKTYTEVTASLKDFIADESLKKFRSDCQKAVNVPVNAISGVSSAHLRDKLSKLTSLLNGSSLMVGGKSFNPSQHPLGLVYCTYLLAERILKQGEDAVSVKFESAFPIALVVLELCKNFPQFGQLLIGKFHQVCPYLVPIYWIREPGMSKEEYYRKLGFKYSGTERESIDMFLKRQSGVVRLYFSLVISEIRGETKNRLLHISEAWRWLAAFTALEPSAEISATILYDMLEVTGHLMLKTYQKQFFKIIHLICVHFVPKIEKVTPEGKGGPVTRLKSFLEELIQSQNLKPPKGMLPADFL